MKRGYIDAEKLKEEINERLAFYLGTAQSLKDTNTIDGFDEALEIIDSLQKEQPDADLEAEVDKYLVENYTNDTDVETPFLERMFSHDRNDLVQFALHFAEWGAVHLNAGKEE